MLAVVLSRAVHNCVMLIMPCTTYAGFGTVSIELNLQFIDSWGMFSTEL
jgi:hypothetical protein